MAQVQGSATNQVEQSVPRVRSEVVGARRHSYSAASFSHSELALWRPSLVSADAEILRDAKTIRARTRDVARNHPYGRQAVRISRQGVIGKKLRYSCRPDHRFLGLDFEEAVRWGQEWERIWESYAHSPIFSVDAGRRMNFTQLMQLAHDSDRVDGEILVTAEWDKTRKWKTCFQVIDVDRLENPHGRPETQTLKAGVQLNGLSAPLGYHIRNSHPAEYGLNARNQFSWSFVHRETDWGRPIAMHSYDIVRAGQTRGISEFASVLTDMKMGREYTETALQHAVLQASYAAVLESQQNYKDALELLGTDPTGDRSPVDFAEEHLEAQLEYHDEVGLRFNGARIPVLYPGEKLNLLTPGKTAGSLEEFQKHAVKSYSAGLGVDPITTSQNYSDVNYSSAKMANATNYRTYETRRERLFWQVALPMIAAVFEEAVFEGVIKLPRGVSEADFYDARDALIRGTMLTQGAPNLDPVKEAQALKLELEIGSKTLQDACAERGEDYLDTLDQLAREKKDREDRGLPPLGPGQYPPALPGTGNSDQQRDGNKAPSTS